MVPPARFLCILVGMKFVERTFDHPLVSVIIAGERCDEDLKKSIRSAQEQSYGNLEMVLVTADGCEAVTEDALNGVNMHTVTWSSLPQAFNHGLSVCSGDMVLFLSAGHELHREFLEKGNEWLQLFNASALQCATMVEKEGVIDSIVLPLGSGGSFEKNLIRGRRHILHSFLLRRDVCAPFQEDLGTSFTSDFLFSSLHGKAVVVKEEYIGAFCSEAGHTTTLQQAMQEARIIGSHLSELRGPVTRFTAMKRLSHINACYRKSLNEGAVSRDEGYERNMQEHTLLPSFLFRSPCQAN